MVLMRGVTREECCAGDRLDTAWSNSSLPMNEVSLLGFLGIVSCKPCKGKQTNINNKKIKKNVESTSSTLIRKNEYLVYCFDSFLCGIVIKLKSEIQYLTAFNLHDQKWSDGILVGKHCEFYSLLRYHLQT